MYLSIYPKVFAWRFPFPPDKLHRNCGILISSEFTGTNDHKNRGTSRSIRDVDARFAPLYSGNAYLSKII